MMKKDCSLCLLINPITLTFAILCSFGYLYCYTPEVTNETNANLQEVCKTNSLDLKKQGPEQSSLAYLFIPTTNFIGAYLGSIFQARFLNEKHFIKVID